MKYIFNTNKTPLEQMKEDLSIYSDPCASFISESPKFLFGNEKSKVAAHDNDDLADSEVPGEVSDTELPVILLQIDDLDDTIEDEDEDDADKKEKTCHKEAEEFQDKIDSIQSELDSLKSEIDAEMEESLFLAANKILKEEFGGNVVPASGEVNGVPVIEKYQDPASGEVFVKAEDGRIFAVTIGFGGEVESVKRTSFNPAIPQAYVRTDSGAISALGIDLSQE